MKSAILTPLLQTDYSLPHEEKELFFYDIAQLRSTEALFGIEADIDRDEEDDLSSSAVAPSEDFARSAGYSVVGGEGTTQAFVSCERLKRKYSRLSARERRAAIHLFLYPSLAEIASGQVRRASNTWMLGQRKQSGRYNICGFRLPCACPDNDSTLSGPCARGACRLRGCCGGWQRDERHGRDAGELHWRPPCVAN